MSEYIHIYMYVVIHVDGISFDTILLNFSITIQCCYSRIMYIVYYVIA